MNSMSNTFGIGNIIFLVFIVGLLQSTGLAETPYQIAWVDQLGTATHDCGHGVSTDTNGNVFISGHTAGSLGGDHVGGNDAFIIKYNGSGNRSWSRQLGTTSSDISYGVSVDPTGNAFISGYTYGNLDGINAGYQDAFVARYDESGVMDWTRQLGTANRDISCGVSTDANGNAFISGYTYGSLDGDNFGSADAFVTKYDASGSLLWTRQLGSTDDDISNGVSTDVDGNVFISGNTYGSLYGDNAGNDDAFVTKYNNSGTLQWTRQIGSTEGDSSCGVSTDANGNVFISGYTYGSLDGDNFGSADAFVTKYDASGSLLWTRQLGTTGWDNSRSVFADAEGNVFISGITNGDFGGGSAGNCDAFVGKYDGSGNLLWTRQFGTADYDIAFGVSTDGVGNVFIAGETEGNFGDTNAGYTDAFIIKLVRAGDYNHDGYIDQADFTTWADSYGDSGMNLPADGNGDRVIDQADYTIWADNYGSTLTTPPTTPIPEPTTLAFLLTLTTLTLLNRSSRRSSTRKTT